MSQTSRHLQSSSSSSIHRSYTFSKKRLGLASLFLIWLCLILAFTTVNTLADEIPPPNGAHAIEEFDTYFEDTTCSVHGGGCCSDMTSIDCQGWFCIKGVCSALQCDYCSDDPAWFCGYVEGVTRNQGLACKHRAFVDQPCNNKTMPCMGDLICSGNNDTCQFTPELWDEYQDDVKSRRVTMAGMIIVLIGMFIAMRRMLKNEEARRRQIWEPVDSSPEASILRRLAEDTQRRVTGGWGQISESLVEGGNAATAAVGTAFSRIRNNVRNAAAGRGGLRPEDCDDDSLEMLPNGRRAQTRRELEEDMRNFLLEGDDEEDEDDNSGHGWNQSRDEDGLLAHHRGSSTNTGSSAPSRSDNTISPAPASSSATQRSSTQEGFPDEPPAYDEIRTNGLGHSSLIAGLNGDGGANVSSPTATGATRSSPGE
ncbi:hypothetical protein BGZ58_000344 [Dissophora ornata]|nr:hypothetical protein BGZ58_000344 [Dissophora ornata]